MDSMGETTRADEIEWPSTYVDPATGETHGWDDEVPPGEDGPADPPYTYREMVGDQAEAAGMDIEEYLNSLAYQRNRHWDDDDEDVPAWAQEDYY